MAIVGVDGRRGAGGRADRFIETQLYAVQPMDWVSFAGAGGVMLTAATVASVAPALRALRLDPIRALRRGPRSRTSATSEH